MSAGGARTVTLGICQVSSTPYATERNRALGLAAVERAFDQGATVALLPELSVPGYGCDPARMGDAAEPCDGPTVSGWSQLAARHGGLVAGGFCERDGGDIFNTAVVVDGSGIVVRYRKLHLFGAEKQAFAPGNLGLPVAETAAGVIGVCVCYDLRFVETVRILALRGAELVLVPTAWVPGFDRDPWDADGVASQAHGVLVQANLNQVFIACASHAGTLAGQTFLGSSLVADPLGRRVCGPLPRDRDEIALVHIDLDEARMAQRREELVMPRADRRRDLYALAIDGELL